MGFSYTHAHAHFFISFICNFLLLFSHHLKTSLHLSGTVLSRMDLSKIFFLLEFFQVSHNCYFVSVALNNFAVAGIASKITFF